MRWWPPVGVLLALAAGACADAPDARGRSVASRPPRAAPLPAGLGLDSGWAVRLAVGALIPQDTATAAGAAQDDAVVTGEAVTMGDTVMTGNVIAFAVEGVTRDSVGGYAVRVRRGPGTWGAPWSSEGRVTVHVSPDGRAVRVDSGQ